jgi:hypothetical protein
VFSLRLLRGVLNSDGEMVIFGSVEEGVVMGNFGPLESPDFGDAALLDFGD